MSVEVMPYLDCDSHNESSESLFKRLLYVDAEGNLYLGVITFEGEIVEAFTP